MIQEQSVWTFSDQFLSAWNACCDLQDQFLDDAMVEFWPAIYAGEILGFEPFDYAERS